MEVIVGKCGEEAKLTGAYDSSSTANWCILFVTSHDFSCRVMSARALPCRSDSDNEPPPGVQTCLGGGGVSLRLPDL